MTTTGGLACAFLLLTAQPAPHPSLDAPGVVADQAIAFAPPLGQPMTYRVLTRRISRDGSLMNFTSTYQLQWHRVGRGYRLESLLQRLDSDARPEVTRTLTGMLEPLVGQTIAYLVAPDGRDITLVDPDGVWERVMARIRAVAEGSNRPEARQVMDMVAALPSAERERLFTADIRALVAPANEEIPQATPNRASGVTVSQAGVLRSITRTERDSLAMPGQSQPLQIDTLWAVDTRTGLVMREQRQSWIGDQASAERTLVEERIRVVEPAS